MISMKRFLLGVVGLLSFAYTLAQPANDDCSGAIFVPMGGPEICIPIVGDNTDATDSGIDPGCAFYQGGDIWFNVTVPPTGIAIIETSAVDGSAIADGGMAVYSGSCDDLTLLDCDDDGGEGLFSLVELFGLTPGEELYIAVWEFGGDNFGEISICAYQPPVCPDIEPFTFDVSSNCDGDSLTVQWASETAGATFIVEYGAPGFTPGTGTQITGVVGTDGPPAYITGLPNNTPYDVYLHQECGDFFTDTLFQAVTTLGPIANSDCANAIPLTVGPPETCNPIVGTIGCNDGPDLIPEPGCAAYTGGEVWYSFEAPGTGVLTIETSTAGGIGDGGMALYGGSCDNLELIDCDDDGGEGLFSLIEAIGLTPGETYYVAVWEFGGNAEGDFNICAYLPPVCPDIDPFTFTSDGCSDTSLDVTWETTAVGATYFVEYGEVGFTPGQGTEVTGIVGTDGPPVTVGGLSADTQYDFYVHQVCGGFITDTIFGSFSTGQGPVLNDDCANATPLTVGGPDECVPTESFNTCASSGGIDPGCAFYQGGEVWFSFVAPDAGSVLVETSAAPDGFTDGGLALYGGTCDALELIDCNDDGGDGLFSLIEADGLTPGETYYAAVWEYGNNAFGSFNICVYQPPTCPSPDIFSLVIDSASTDYLEFNWGVVNADADFIVEYGPQGFTPGTGTTIQGTIGVDGPPVGIPGLMDGSNYDIYVQEICGVGDSSQVVGPELGETNSFPPAYDDLCDALELIVNDPPVQMTNEGATAEPNEPIADCWLFESEQESAWAYFVAPATGTVSVTTDFVENELHDTHITLYSLDGDCSDLLNLLEVGCDEDGGFVWPNGWTSIIVVDALTPGQTYYVLIDGYAANDGNFFIQVVDEVLSVEELTESALDIYPNPTNDKLFVTGEMNGKAYVEWFSMSGQRLGDDQWNMEAGVARALDVTDLPRGAYFLRLTVGDQVAVKRFIVE